jgi:hypothetical protein
MEDGRSFRAPRRRRWPVALAAAVMVTLGVAAGAPRGAVGKPEVWTILVQTGDEVAAGGRRATLAGQPLTTRKAYLLAFHEAQDAGDLEHVLAVADRLDAVDEPDLAAHVRHAAAVLLGEIGG